MVQNVFVRILLGATVYSRVVRFFNFSRIHLTASAEKLPFFVEN
jgi:hypothetical protein